MVKGRSEKALINIVAGFSNEIVALVCGLILPRLILTTFGSSYNGIASSITQFISCISLMQAGIGGVTRAALYKPLAVGCTHDISVIVIQTEKFMRKVSLIFVVFSLVFAAIYPIWISNDFDWMFSFTLILIISLSTFAQYYFGFTYQMLLNADQRNADVLFFNISSTIINTVISVILIRLGGGIHTVKLGSAVIYVIAPLLLCAYARKRYKINRSVNVSTDLIKQRWDAVGYETANFVSNNTDIMVLTIFSTLGEVSIYTVYYYAITAIRKFVLNFITGFGAAFGNMYAKKEYGLMQSNLRIYEVIVFSVTSIVYSVAIVMIIPFAMIYTSGVYDVDYSRPVFGIIMVLAGSFSCFRIPYVTIVEAIGHYKQTRIGAFVEAGINIILSVAFVIKFGLVGVAIGSLVAAVFRTIYYAIYLGKNILKRSIFLFLGHMFIALGISIATYFISRLYMINIDNVRSWILMAVITTLVAVVLTFVTNFVFYRKDMVLLFNKLSGIFRKRRKQNV